MSSEFRGVRAGDRIDHTFAEGAHDLDAILEKVRTDQDLFPAQLSAPVGGIGWMKHPLRSAWADYTWRRDPDEPPYERILASTRFSTAAPSRAR